MGKESTLFVKSLEKAFQLLEAFEKSGDGGRLSHTEMRELTGMDASTVQRMSYTLVQLGYLERGQNRTYMLGKKFLHFTFEYLRHSTTIQRASPILMDLQEETGERIDLSLFEDLEIVYALRRQTKRQTFFATLTGRRVPSFASSGGRAVMGHLPEDVVDDILDRSNRIAITPKTVTSKPEILAAIRESRELGYALCIEQMMLGEIVLASPIFDEKNVPIGAVHIAGSLSEWEPEAFRKIHAPLAISSARTISSKS
ncbi:IclR family transcriptional regulator [Pinisolibacter aquiterrae]|jgi:DNA-binding IclR family transcriptional regulator|uniref:IclR family transcriptional regulator n=1 Tax=Pinisolibacter aquiterrae TaxID=2815579 RepID=UPI001C3CBD35|nr:IclR family transcriptional regulator [Pinisolibacter aquiterrae]MBV5263819.1 IclR family transcriptional regulator [Pinisolibacter aquiterrae]MCC8237321.1 IclR family transcriptional regulator [Pinisolibacter aquiterrae]